MKKIFSRLPVFFLLFVLEACDPPDIDHAYDYYCWSNFHWSVWVPDGDSVWTEVYSGDTLLDVDSMMSPVHYSSLPNSELEFRERLVLRIHVFCNGEWLDEVDFEFENKTDKYTDFGLVNFDFGHTGSSGVQVFTEEQLAKCPELIEYRIYEDTTHPPSCFDP